MHHTKSNANPRLVDDGRAAPGRCRRAMFGPFQFVVHLCCGRLPHSEHTDVRPKRWRITLQRVNTESRAATHSMHRRAPLSVYTMLARSVVLCIVYHSLEIVHLVARAPSCWLRRAAALAMAAFTRINSMTLSRLVERTGALADSNLRVGGALWCHGNI